MAPGRQPAGFGDVAVATVAPPPAGVGGGAPAAAVDLSAADHAALTVLLDPEGVPALPASRLRRADSLDLSKEPAPPGLAKRSASFRGDAASRLAASPALQRTVSMPGSPGRELALHPPHGAVAVKGRRSGMEDRLVVVPRLLACGDPADGAPAAAASCPACAGLTAAHFYAVYDGHGGCQAAHHCAQRLHRNLLKQVGGARFCCSAPGDDLDGGGPDGLSEALVRAYLATDEELAGSEACTGTTAVAALVQPTHILVANTGDSRAVLLRGAQAVALSDDHKAEREDERARVEAAGGHVVSWNGPRVMGVLSMSRALGDHFLRPYVIPDPELTLTPRAPEDRLLILASDGLWDVLSNQEACNIAKFALKKARESGVKSAKEAAQAAAVRLVKTALGKGSGDNISAIVVDLSDGQ